MQMINHCKRKAILSGVTWIVLFFPCWQGNSVINKNKTNVSVFFKKFSGKLLGI